MAVKKKRFEVVENELEFDINEWKDLRNEKRNRTTFDDSQIKYVLKKHPKRENVYYLTMYFKKKILKMMDGSSNPRIMVLQHKKEERRILLTKSSNGYKPGMPSKSSSYFIKCNVFLEREPEVMKSVADPVFHEKGISSGSIIEFSIDN